MPIRNANCQHQRHKALFRKYSFFSLLLLLLLLFSPRSQAIESAAMADFSNKLSALRSLLVVFNFSGPGQLQLVFWQQDGQWRQEWLSRADEKTRLEMAAIGKKSNLKASYPVDAAVSAPLLHLWHPPRLQFWWRDLDIDPQVASYDFLGDLPCLVLGASRAGQDSAQIWLDIESKLLRRIKLSSGLTLDWLGYRSIGNFMLPHQVRIQAPNLLIEAGIDWKSVNSPLSRSLFQADTISTGSVRPEDSSPANPVLEELLILLPEID